MYRRPTVGAWQVNKSGKIARFNIPSVSGYVFPAVMEKNRVGNCSVVLVRKECFEKIGIFDENLHAVEDYELWIKLAKHYEFDSVKEYLARAMAQQHERSISNNRRRVPRATELLHKKHSRELAELPNYQRY